MLKLKAQLLERAKAATILHGYGTFLPEPPEFALLKKNWREVKNLLVSIDLDTYGGYTPIRSFAPKSRLNVRRVTLLHPFDFIIYTALVLALKDAIAKSRLPLDVVFSYRTEKTTSKQIYASAPSFKEFRAAATKKATLNPKWSVGITDIADFFPRIYHHRLINALEIDAYNLAEMLTEALSADENVDYQEVSFILGRLSSLQKPELISIVLENLDRLYPVADAVAAFFKDFKNLEDKQYKEIGTALLRPLLHATETRPSEFYAIWILHVFGQDERWNHGEDLLRIFRETSSDVVRRYSALALARSGSRAQAVAIKEYLNSGSSQCRTAMLLATAKLGLDERKFLKKSLHLTDAFERICSDSHI